MPKIMIMKNYAEAILSRNLLLIKSLRPDIVIALALKLAAVFTITLLIILIYSSKTLWQINFLSLITAQSVIAIVIISKTIDLIGKDRALKVINEITQANLLALTIEDLSRMICQKLHQELKGNFAIILSDNGKLSYYGEAQSERLHNVRVKSVLKSGQQLTVMGLQKISHFHPLHVSGKCVGVLFTEIGIWNNFILSFHQILPVIAAQIYLILENFKTRTLLDEIKINEEREKLRSLILSSISHDLKTPLSSIIGGLSVYEKMNSRDKVAMVTTALEEAIRLNQFISDVLEMTKIKSGSLTLQKQFLNPRAIIERTLQRFEANLKDYRLAMLLSGKISVNFDPISFEQIIQNLVDNIFKYSAKNSRILIYEEAISNDCYKIFFQDEGKGVAPENLDLIFNKFERLTSQGAAIYSSGLGLSIVKALMEINSASISAENVKDNKGIIFILRFHDFQHHSQMEVL
jgi:K+-sensing histidine kinase KdpD